MRESQCVFILLRKDLGVFGAEGEKKLGEEAGADVCMLGKVSDEGMGGWVWGQWVGARGRGGVGGWGGHWNTEL